MKKRFISIIALVFAFCSITNAQSARDYNGTSNLHVSPTGWAMWNNDGQPPVYGEGDEFSTNFQGGLPEGWTTLDADEDKHDWEHIYPEYNIPGHGDYDYMSSASYDNSYGVLHPDNYLITNKVSIVHGSTFSFWACAQMNDCPAEHYGVAVSTTGTDAEDFVTIWEETMIAKDSKEQGNWYQKSIDLSAYAGQKCYLAIRHFNCHDMFRLNVDDVALTVGKSNNVKSNVQYKVSLDGVLETTTENKYYQHDITNLIEGHTYTTEIEAVWSTGETEYLEYEWTYFPCEDYTGVTELTSEFTNNNVELTWTFENAAPPIPGDGDEFSTNFQGGLPEGWTTLDADDDGHDWEHIYPEYDIPGHGDYDYMSSASYDNSYGVLHPDNYLITNRVSITTGSTFSFWACAQSNQYPGEHYGVAVSTTGTDAEDFTTIWEETMIAKDGKEQGNWYQKSIDLSAYAGQKCFLAIRHFNCHDMFRLNVDDVALTVGKNNRSANVLGFLVFRDGELLTPQPLASDVRNYTDETAGYGVHEYCVRVVYGGTSSDEDWYAMSCPSCINYQDIEENNVTSNIYPNPVRNNLTINAIGMTRIIISSVSGQIMMDKTVDSDNEVLDMSALKSGVYMVSIVTENGTAVERITVIK